MKRALFAAVAAVAIVAASADAAAPRYVLVSGPGLTAPALLDDWDDTLRWLLAVAEAPRVRAPRLPAPRFDLALFWGVPERPVPHSPRDASQHGWFYPATATRRAVVDLQVNGIRQPRLAPDALLRTLQEHGVPTASGSWAALRRPLRIPRLDAGSRCPVAEAHSVSRSFGVALGPGPVFPVGLGETATLRFSYPVRPGQGWYPSEWSGNKVRWIGAPTYRGPVLIRGRQLDGPNLVRFENGRLPPAELRLDPIAGRAPGGWRHRATSTRLRAAGCYAYQVDGTAFSRVIVFRAAVA